MDDETLIVDDGELKKYRIELPNLLDDLDISPQAFRLYVHIKRRAGANVNGACWESTKAMAAACRMSTGMVSESKAELLQAKVIRIERHPPGSGKSDIIRLVNLWPANFARYTKPDPDDFAPPAEISPPVHNVNDPFIMRTTPSQCEPPLHNVNLRKNHDKKELIGEEEPKKRECAASPPPVIVEAFCSQCRRGVTEMLAGHSEIGWCAKCKRNMPTVKEKSVKTKANGRAPDPRSSHPAIQAVRGLKAYPQLLVYDDLISTLGDDFDGVKLELCAVAWAKRGYKLMNLGWVFDWYVNGIPETNGGRLNGPQRILGAAAPVAGKYKHLDGGASH